MVDGYLKPNIDWVIIRFAFFQDWVSVTYSGSREKLLIPLRAVFGAESSADDVFWPLAPPIHQTSAPPKSPLKSGSDHTALKAETTASADAKDCPGLEPSRQVILALNPPLVLHQSRNSVHALAQIQKSQWSQEELKYYEAVLAAEEARKESEEPDPGLTSL
jgi:hypothetical protein